MSKSDRHLLFGLVALQNDFVSKQQLIAAFGEWIADKENPLDKIFVKRGNISEEIRTLLNRLVDQHVAARKNSIVLSLHTLSGMASVCEELKQLDDSDIGQSIIHVPVMGNDTYSTIKVHDSPSRSARFKIQNAVGRGGLGVVSIAIDTELNRDVAIKEIRSEFADNPNMRSKFMMEAELTGKLEHPGIVPVYSLGVSENGRPYYAMRFIQGESLSACIRDFHQMVAARTIPYDGTELRKLLRRFLDICSAIEYAHTRGVLHRDLKPGNIMIGKHGETFVVDWGLAKPQLAQDPSHVSNDGTDPILVRGSGSELTRDGSLVGTPAYAPPEQMEGRISEINERSDVYGLGAILYDLLCNAPPVAGSSIEELISNSSNGRIIPPSQRMHAVPKSLSSISMKAIAFRPMDRYSSPRDLMDDVVAWMDDLPVKAHPDNVLETSLRWLRKNKTFSLTALVSIIVLSIVSSVFAAAIDYQRRVARGAEKIAIEERQEADRQADKAKLSQSNAEKYYYQAKQAVDRFLLTVSQDPQLALPGLQPVRRNLLESALEYYDEFARLHEGDESTLSLDLAEAYRQAALIHVAMGTPSKAEATARRAAEIYDRLMRIAPSTSVSIGQAENWLLIGQVLQQLGQQDASQEFLEQSNRAFADFNEKGTEESSSLLRYAESLDSIGVGWKQRGEPEKALEFFGKALRYREELRTKSAFDHDGVLIASSHELIAGIFAEQRKPKEAREQYELAVRELAAIPLEKRSRESLSKGAELEHNLAALAASDGNQEESLALYQNAWTYVSVWLLSIPCYHFKTISFEVITISV